MIIDKENLFSDDQAITADAASTNIIDLGSLSSRVQPYIERDAEIHCMVTEAFATLTSLEIQVQTDDDVAFGSPTTHQKVSVALAGLTAGKQIPLGDIPEGSERYIRLYYDVTGSSATAGKIHAGLVLDKQSNGM